MIYNPILSISEWNSSHCTVGNLCDINSIYPKALSDVFPFTVSNNHWSPIFPEFLPRNTGEKITIFFWAYLHMHLLLLCWFLPKCTNKPNKPQFITFVSYSKLVSYFCLNTLYVAVFIHVITDYNYLNGREWCLPTHSSM